MTLGTQRMLVGGLAMVLAAAGSQAGAQSQTQSQQNVPNAPEPQTLPTLNTITPVAPALPTTPSQAGASSSTPEARDDSRSAAEIRCRSRGRRRSRAEARRTRFRVNVQYHAIPFTVKDSKGHLVPGLTYRDVRVYENGVLQHMATVSDGSGAAVGGAGDRPERDARHDGEDQRLAGCAAGGVLSV